MQGATIRRDEHSGAVVVARIMRGGAADRSGECISAGLAEVLAVVPQPAPLATALLFLSCPLTCLGCALLSGSGAGILFSFLISVENLVVWKYLRRGVL